MSLILFEQKFSENKLNFTPQRRTIAKVVIESENHPDIDEIFFRAKNVDKTISLATVYRTINLFTDLGLISKRDFKEKKSRYECKMEQDHDHIILEGGEIIEFISSELEDIIHKIVEKHNLVLKDYNIEIYCSKK